MTGSRVLSVGATAGFLLGLLSAAWPLPAHAAFVPGKQLQTITPTAATTVDPSLGVVDPTCDSQGGTSMAVVQGSKLANVNAVQFPVLLAMSCLDNGGSAAAVARRSRINFIDPSNNPSTTGRVIKAISTTIASVVGTPSNGWAHLVNRPDKGDLLGCGNDGTLYSIDFSQFNSTPDGTATPVSRPAGLPANCAGLAWDAEQDMIYQGATGGTVNSFKDGTTTLLGTFITPTCSPIGVAITGGVLVVACDGINTILRLDKSTGAVLAVNGTLGALELLAGTSISPGFGDLACDPATFQSQFKDAMWSRRGSNGNGAVALEFPAFTCGLPSTATVLAPGLSGPAAATCFDGTGAVKDDDHDGIPDCWEDGSVWVALDGKPGIDFDGDGVRDLKLCVMVDTNGDGVADTEECATKDHRDLFVEIDWMQDHKPDPLALRQASLGSAGITSVWWAFNAAPLMNASGFGGIRLHLQVDEQVTFTTLAGLSGASHADELVFTPCTGPATFAKPLPSQAADFDDIKKLNFGTAAERALLQPQKDKTLNAKRLAFRYVLFAHNQVSSTAPGGGSTGSGCSEIGGDDAAITLGSFTSTTVGGVSHNRGTTDQQAGTFMHEFGHTLGLRHGGGDNDNCKPNHLSVMSYSRQFAGSPITNRRLDYSRAVLPSLTQPSLNEASLNELTGLADPSFGLDPSLSAIMQGGVTLFAADQTAYGPGAFSVAPASGVSCNSGAGANCINWNKDKQGPNPKYTTPVSADINQGSGGCDGSGTIHTGYNDWGNLQYRASAALDFAGGVHSANTNEHTSITSEQEAQFFLAGDLDANGIPDAEDCNFTTTASTTALVAPNATTVPIGTNPTFVGFAPFGTAFLGPGGNFDDFSYTGTDGTGFTGVTGVSAGWPSPTTVTAACTHRIDIKPADPTNVVKLGQSATVTVGIYSEVNGTQVWDAPAVVVVNDLINFPLTFSADGGTVFVVTNKNGQGTCSPRDIDPKDTFKDLLCQFPVSGSLVIGTQYGEVRGFYRVPNTNPTEYREFRARQLITVIP